MAGLASSLGLGFLLTVDYLFPLTIVFLAFAVGTLLIGAGTKRGYKPFILGLISAMTILISKFYFENNLVMYLGLMVLIIASVWHSFPEKWAKRLFRRRLNYDTEV